MKQPAARRQILVTGLANSGKTTVCNQLTGTYALVANYPMTTVEPKTSSYLFEQTLYEVTDMPGINGFTAYSEEELIFRKLAIELRPDILIQCIDANRLKQSLYLTAELFELGLPLVICLTAVDETARKGKMVDSALLSRLLQVPVIEAGLPGGGRLYDLKEAAAHAAAVQNPLKYSEEIERVVQSLSGQIGGESGTARVCALLSLLKDPYVADTASASGDWRYWGLSLSARQSLAAASNALQAVVPGNPAARIIRERGRWVDGISSQVLGSVTPQSSGFALKAAYYSRHPLWGLFFLAAVLLAVYLLVVKAAGWIGEQLETGVGEPIAQFVRDGVASPFLENLLVGDYGLLTLGLLNCSDSSRMSDTCPTSPFFCAGPSNGWVCQARQLCRLFSDSAARPWLP